MAAQVIRLRPRVVDAWLLEEAEADLAAHAAEEQEAAEAVLPLLRRLELLGHECGPAAHQLVAAVAYWHVRHQRRWSPEDEPGAAA